MERNTTADRPGSGMAGEGRLVFRVSTAGGAIPLLGAEVTLRRSRSEAEEGAAPGGAVVAVLYTDADGKTEVLPLPAPARSLSQLPARDGSPQPYALYDADVRLRGFYSQSYSRIPIFDGITSIQHAALIPLPEANAPDGDRPDDERFVEGAAPEL